MTTVGRLLRENLAKDIQEGVGNNSNMFFLSYQNVTGNQMSDLRKNLRQAGAHMMVTRNRIAQIALKNLKKDELAQQLNGQTAFVWSSADSVQVSKILVDFSKELEHVVIQGGLLEDKVLKQADVKKLSELPSREVLLSMVLATILAPLTRFAGALNAKSRDLLSILKQLSEKKGGS